MLYNSWASALAGTTPLIGAHRGASAYAPENSMAAFILAIEMGAHFLELDVHLTKDAVPVVIHDSTLDRTAGQPGRVKDFTLTDLKRVAPIPALSEVLSLCTEKTLLNIELKPDDNREELTRQVIAAVQKQNLCDRVLISSFDHASLPLIKNLAPGIMTAMLYETPLADPIELAKKLGAYAIHPDFRLVNRELVSRALSAKLAVIVWTVDRPLYIRYFQQLRVSAIITNKPDAAFKALDAPKC